MTTLQPPIEQVWEIDRAVDDLVRGEAAWAACGLAKRRELIERVHAATAEQAEAWVRAAAAYKRLPEGSPLLGEEWITGPYPVLTSAGTLASTIGALEAGRSPVDGFSVRPAPGGRVAVRVLPHSVWDRLLLSGFSAEVWMRPGVTKRAVRSRAGLGQRRPTLTGGVGVVLGAGNITSIPVLDVLYELYAHNRVVALKLNPVTDGLFEVFSRVLAPLIDIGAVRILTGGADVGRYLVHHPKVGHVHMTGSAATHDAIVFGTGEEGAARKKAGTPLLDKPVTSELGGVSPTIVVPGAWSEADLRYQAEHIATQKLHNGGYNCVASQVVVVGSDWPQKDRFLAHVRRALSEAPARPAYYPGSDGRVEGAVASYAGAERIGGGRVLIEGLDAADPGPALTSEYFAPVLAVLEIPGDAGTFLTEAVRAANERFAGTLGVNLIAHPRTIARLGSSLDDAIADLRYGTVALNAWTGVGYLTAAATWGAFPGHTLDDVQSGIGVVHNALLLDAPERTVVRGPFRPAPRSVLHGELALSPKPPWFVDNRTAATTGRRLVDFAAAPRWSALPGIFASALRG
ncbi:MULTISPECIES: aldehyde dehydrogenase family protein [Streptomyces]|uniref:Aldehyde dehydrogenase family protein n=1 Tax=Streptomyces solicathayae TaxID=3081768 RepID=A0ABZ0LN08_9ACTN|nr:aldehyde dehydrogenase family protein [Streptomyces sp. HUAS YS2]WOX20876.1 aldehyde dehydrogenase family protein [Streptomyces sp. HUAS YS2]